MGILDCMCRLTGLRVVRPVQACRRALRCSLSGAVQRVQGKGSLIREGALPGPYAGRDRRNAWHGSLQLARTLSLGKRRHGRPARGVHRRRREGDQGEGGGRGKGRRPRHEGRGHSGMREHRRPCVRGGTGGEVDAARCVPGSGGGAFDLKDVTSSSEPGGHSPCMRRGWMYSGALKRADPFVGCTGKTRANPPAASKRASKTMEWRGMP